MFILLILVLIFTISINSFAQKLVASFDVDNKNSNVQIIDTADGKFDILKINNRNYVKNRDFTQFLYFAVSSKLRNEVGSDAWILIEGTSDVLGDLKVRYNSKTDTYALTEPIRTFGDKKSDFILVNLKDSDFKGTQNAGADFRIESPSYYISSIKVFNGKPSFKEKVLTPNERKAKALEIASNIPKAKTNGMKYVLGDSIYDLVDKTTRWTIPFGHNSDAGTGKLLSGLGATSVESYVTWELCETDKEGKWNWENWDRQIKNLNDNGLKLTPFLILGPAYSTPDWFRASEDHFPCVCLEHGEKSKIESLWNPNLEKWIDRFVKEYASKYNDPKMLESVLLGIQGDYGEAIYSVSGGWTELIPGPYHAHGGFWCNDPYALKDYKLYLEKKYIDIESLNELYKTDYSNFEELDFPGKDNFENYKKNISKDTPSKKREYLDFVTWYREAMINLADKWLFIANKYFDKDIPIYLCTGGNMEPTHGSDFSLQCKVAAKHNGGVRITNEGSEYKWNNCQVRLVDTAARFYGAKFGHEPATNVSASGLVARIYGSVSSGAEHHHEYARNVFSGSDRIEAHKKNIKFMEYYSDPVVPVAIFYPSTALTLDFPKYWSSFTNFTATLRDISDHDYLDENLIRDGALEKYKVLIIKSGDIIEPKDANIIAEWAKNGGKVIVLGVNELICNVEGTSESEKILFSKDFSGEDYGNGYVIRAIDFGEIRQLLAVFYLKNGYPLYDTEDDQVFGALVSENTILYHNSNSEDKKVYYAYKGDTYSVTVPAYGIEKIILK